MEIRKKDICVKNIDFDHNGRYAMDVGNESILIIEKIPQSKRFRVYKKDIDRTFDLGIMTEDLINLILRGFKELKYK